MMHGVRMQLASILPSISECIRSDSFFTYSSIFIHLQSQLNCLKSIRKCRWIRLYIATLGNGWMNAKCMEWNEQQFWFDSSPFALHDVKLIFKPEFSMNNQMTNISSMSGRSVYALAHHSWLFWSSCRKKKKWKWHLKEKYFIDFGLCWMVENELKKASNALLSDHHEHHYYYEL